MREWIFLKILSCLEDYTPEPVRRIQLQILMNLTARAFRVRGKQIWCVPSTEGLEAYAFFTKKCMEKSDRLTSQDLRRMYRISYRTGRLLRLLTGLSEDADMQRLVFLLYHNIGISMSGGCPGDICVSTCFFSRFYTPKQCKWISAMDAGIIAGIYGGGRLRFTQRITQHCDCCHACFDR